MNDYLNDEYITTLSSASKSDEDKTAFKKCRSLKKTFGIRCQKGVGEYVDW